MAATSNTPTTPSPPGGSISFWQPCQALRRNDVEPVPLCTYTLGFRWWSAHYRNTCFPHVVKVVKIFTWLAHSPWLTREHLIKRRKTLRRNTPSKILAYLAPSVAVLSLTAAILILSGVNPAGAIPGLTSPSAVDQFLDGAFPETCLLYTSPSPRDRTRSRMPSSA